MNVVGALKIMPDHFGGSILEEEREQIEAVC